jgi:hypothetical protein
LREFSIAKWSVCTGTECHTRTKYSTTHASARASNSEEQRKNACDKDSWDPVEDVFVMHLLLDDMEETMEEEVFADPRFKTPALALEVQRLKTLYGDVMSDISMETTQNIKAIMIACYFMSAPPSGQELGDFIQELEKDKDEWSNAINPLAALLMNGTEVRYERKLRSGGKLKVLTRSKLHIGTLQ